MAERGVDREDRESALVALLGSRSQLSEGKLYKEEAWMADFYCDLLFSGMKKVNPPPSKHSAPQVSAIQKTEYGIPLPVSRIQCFNRILVKP
jgi:hypothetical protein